MKTIKILALVAVAISALSLGACAHKQETVSTSTGASTTGYHK